MLGLGQGEATRPVSQKPVDSDPAVTCQELFQQVTWVVTSKLYQLSLRWRWSLSIAGWYERPDREHPEAWHGARRHARGRDPWHHRGFCLARVAGAGSRTD